MKVPEERLNMIDPVCELFPKMAACHYYRYGMGGIEDDRHSICVLGLNMINDKVFIGKKHTPCMIFTILLTLRNSEQKNGLLVKRFCFSSNFDETW